MIIFKNWLICKKGLFRRAGEINLPKAKTLYLTAEDSKSFMDRYTFLEHLSKSWTLWNPDKRYMFQLDQLKLWAWEKVI